jgi:hypothetical protein
MGARKLPGAFSFSQAIDGTIGGPKIAGLSTWTRAKYLPEFSRGAGISAGVQNPSKFAFFSCYGEGLGSVLFTYLHPPGSPACEKVT